MMFNAPAGQETWSHLPDLSAEKAFSLWDKGSRHQFRCGRRSCATHSKLHCRSDCRRVAFALAGVYPDLGILKPLKIAIELDHSGRGAGLKIALAKAAFNVLCGEWEYCFVLFYNQNGKVSLEGKKENEIRKIYEEQFRTQVILLP